MGLLDGGLAAIFGAAFSGLYLPGTLHRSVITRDPVTQRVTSTTFEDQAIRYQPDSLSAEARARAGIPDTDVRALILAAPLPVDPTAEDEITIGSGRYRVVSVAVDPARSHFSIRATPV